METADAYEIDSDDVSLHTTGVNLNRDCHDLSFDEDNHGGRRPFDRRGSSPDASNARFATHLAPIWRVGRACSGGWGARRARGGFGLRLRTARVRASACPGASIDLKAARSFDGCFAEYKMARLLSLTARRRFLWSRRRAMDRTRAALVIAMKRRHRRRSVLSGAQRGRARARLRQTAGRGRVSVSRIFARSRSRATCNGRPVGIELDAPPCEWATRCAANGPRRKPLVLQRGGWMG